MLAYPDVERDASDQAWLTAEEARSEVPVRDPDASSHSSDQSPRDGLKKI